MQLSENAKAVRKIYNRAYYQTHKERIKENNRRYWERKVLKEKGDENALQVYSIKNIATILKTDKQKVYRTLKRLQVQPCRQEDNKFYYDNRAVELVRESLKISDDAPKEEKTDECIKTLKQELQTMQNKIEELQDMMKSILSNYDKQVPQ